MWKRRLFAGLLVLSLICTDIGWIDGTEKNRIYAEEIDQNTEVKDEVPEENEEPLIEEAVDEFDGKTYTITFQANGGTVEQKTKEVTNGLYYGELPVAEKGEESFYGWYTKKTGGYLVEEEDIVDLNGDITLYAHYESDRITLHFDPNGGKMCEGAVTSKKIAMNNTSYGNLPKAEWEGHAFAGWFTDKEKEWVDGEQTCISKYKSVDLMEDTILYAHWIDIAEQDYSYEKIHYSFSNNAETYGYQDTYFLPLSLFYYTYQQSELAEEKHKNRKSWGGNCFGMCATALLLSTKGTNITPQDFGTARTANSMLSPNDCAEKYGFTMRKFIEIFQISNHVKLVLEGYSQTKNNNQLLTQKMKQINEKKALPVIIGLNWQGEGHAILAYKADDSKIYVYDPNFPNEERYISITRDAQGMINSWSYMHNNKRLLSSSDEQCSLRYFSTEGLLQVWFGREGKYYEDEIAIQTNVEDFIVYNADGTWLASVEDGVLRTKNENVAQGISPGEDEGKEENSEYKTRIIVPVGEYRVKNTSQQQKEFKVCVEGVEHTIAAETQAEKVIVCMNEMGQDFWCKVPNQNGQSYSIALASTAGTEVGKLHVSGIGNGKSVLVDESDGVLKMANYDGAVVKVNDVASNVFKINATHDGNGTITKAGASLYFQGRKIKYKMEPKEGYMVSKVTVDGKGCGNVRSYTFDNIQADHTISVTYEPVSFAELRAELKADVLADTMPDMKVKLRNQVFTEGKEYISSIVSKDAQEIKVKVQGLGVYKNVSETFTFKVGDKAGTKKYNDTKTRLEEEEKQKKEKEREKEREKEKENTIEVGETITLDGLMYKVINIDTKQVALCKVKKGKKTVVIPDEVVIKDVSFAVVEVKSGLWKNDAKLRKVVIGKNIKKIGVKAFYKAKNCKNIVFKGTALEKIGNKAFGGISKKASIKAPKKKRKAYNKMFAKSRC